MDFISILLLGITNSENYRRLRWAVGGSSVLTWWNINIWIYRHRVLFNFVIDSFAR